MQLLNEIIRLLLTMVPQQRQRAIRDEGAVYEIIADDGQAETDLNLNDLATLLQNIPLP